jgi:TPR repeat protein
VRSLKDSSLKAASLLAKSVLAVVLVGLLGAAPVQAAEASGWALRAVTYRGALPPLVAAAQSGNAAAQARLGFMYATGRGVPQNYTLACYWYRRGAEQGNAAAQHLLGLAYDKGFGVPTDYILAHMWLNLAAARTRGDTHEDNVRLRDAVAGKLSLGQLADAQQLAAVWVPKRERF